MAETTRLDNMTVGELKKILNIIPDKFNDRKIEVQLIHNGCVDCAPLLNVEVEYFIGGEQRLELNGIWLTEEEKAEIKERGYCYASDGSTVEDWLEEMENREEY